VEPAAAESYSSFARQEVRVVLDEELDRLPEKYRAPLVLHYLENKTLDQTAAELGWPYGTVCTRLTRGKNQLRLRLAKRGLGLTAAAVAAALAQEAAASVLPAKLADGTIRALVSGAASVPALALAREYLSAQLSSRLKWALTFLLAVGTAAGAGVILSRDQSQQPPDSARVAFNVGEAADRQAGLDSDRDPLPDGAVLRLGSARFRGGATHAAFSADGRTLTTIGRSARTWDAMTGRPLATTYHPDLRGQCELSGNGKFAATQEYMAANFDSLHGQIRLRHVPSIALLRTLEVPGMGGVLKYSISYHGTRVAAGGRFEILVWDVATGKLINRLPLTSKDYPSSCPVTLSPDGKLLAAPDSRGSAIRLWDVDNGKERKPLTIPGTRFTQWSFSGNGKVLMACGGGKLHLWEPQTGSLIRSFSTGRETIYPTISFDGKVIATHGTDGIRLWDATTGKERSVLYQPKPFGLTHGVLTFSPDGRYLVVNGGLQIERWEVATACRVQISEEPDLNASSNHNGCYAAISPDGDIVATCVCGTLQLWEAQTGRKVGLRP
jgi:WD40 repeat protein